MKFRLLKQIQGLGNPEGQNGSETPSKSILDDCVVVPCGVLFDYRAGNRTQLSVPFRILMYRELDINLFFCAFELEELVEQTLNKGSYIDIKNKTLEEDIIC